MVALLKNYFCVLIVGTKSVATPGELRGYWEAKQLYGNKSISWESLLIPSITMCNNGVEVNWHLAQTLKNKEQVINNDPGLRHVHGSDDMYVFQGLPFLK